MLSHVHISYGVSKLGAEIPSVSLPVGCTCRPDAPCLRKCYGRRGRFSFSRTKALIQNNQCPKYCGDCVITGESCWDLKSGEAVCFDEH